MTVKISLYNFNHTNTIIAENKSAKNNAVSVKINELYKTITLVDIAGKLKTLKEGECYNYLIYLERLVT